MDFKEASKKFISSWGVDSASDVESEITAKHIAESHNLYIPRNLFSFLKDNGDLYTPNILDAVCKLNESTDSNKEAFDVQNFIALKEMISITQTHVDAGMPSGYLAFANDCMGNLFLIKKSDCVKGTTDCPIYFFDHDFVTIERVHNSLLEMLIFYNSLKT